MKRCATCHGVMWPLPWLHIGFYTVARNDYVMWHARCGRPRWVQQQIDRQRGTFQPTEIEITPAFREAYGDEPLAAWQAEGR